MNGVVSGYVRVRNADRSTVILSGVGTANFGCSAGNTVAITIVSTIVPPTGGRVLTTTRRRVSGIAGGCHHNLVGRSRHDHRMVRV